MLKFFFNEKALCLCTTEEIADVKNSEIIHPHISKLQVQVVVEDFLLKKSSTTVYIYSGNFSKLEKHATSLFSLGKTAGGIVFNQKDQLLAILKNNKWDFPKGKCEDNEVFSATALREVSEECGLNPEMLEMIKEVDSTFYISCKEGKNILKKTFWYVMKYSGDEPLTPALSEGIKDARWFSKHELSLVLQNTYSHISELISRTINNSE